MRNTLPGKALPGYSRRITSAGIPAWIRRICVCGTYTYSRRVPVLDSLYSQLLGLLLPAVMSWPTSTLRAVMVPSKGASTC